MKKYTLTLLGLLLMISSVIESHAQTPVWAKETKEQKDQRMAWWKHDRFGMFIHWGIYALPARHEWVKNYEKISDVDYQKYFDNFDPDLYNPTEWAAKCKAAGMKYVVLTTKHHDGFCLWDTKYTDFNVKNTPYGKDLIKPFVDAFRAEGIKIGFYYSVIDWHHAQFPYDNMHPNRPKDADEMTEANKGRDIKKYQQFMKDQVTELLTKYGQIDELFFDFSYPDRSGGKGHEDWDSEGLLKLARKYQPQIVVNNRLDMGHTDWGWDYLSPEQFMPNEWPKHNGERAYWETCQTFSGSWGYHRDQYTWKSPRQLVVMLIETVSKGGNLLLNVGPTARGVFDDRANDRLDAIGRWTRFHGDAIYGCTQAPEGFEVPKNCILTYNEKTNRLYLHILEWPFKSLHMPNYKGKFKYAQLLNDDSEVRFSTPTTKGSHTIETAGQNDVILHLPVEQPNVEVPVIELILE